MNKGRYQRLVGKLIYLSLTRLGVTYVVTVVSQFMHSPTNKHLNVAYILKYLKGTPRRGLLLKKNEDKGIMRYVYPN